MTAVDEALARAESLSGVPNEGDFALLAKEVRRLQEEKLEYDMGDYSNTLIGKQWRETSADNERLEAEVQRLNDLLPFFARLPSFAAWVEDARATADELRRVREDNRILAEDIASYREIARLGPGVVSANEQLRAKLSRLESLIEMEHDDSTIHVSRIRAVLNGE